MGIDGLTRLHYAIVATRHGRGAATMASRVRAEGVDAFEAVLEQLTPDLRSAVDQDAERLDQDGVSAVLLCDEDYPPALHGTRAAPAALFLKGPRNLLDRPGFGICGARSASASGLQAARSCGNAISSKGFSVISGYARGVDHEAHIGSLLAGGPTVMVLPEGIENFRIRQGELTDSWDPSQVTVVSQFSPQQPWSAGNAMARNKVIVGLSRGLVVVEAGETGGTIAAGLHALDQGRAVLVLKTHSSVGNQQLLARGATLVKGRHELERFIDQLPANGRTQLTLM